MQVFDANPAILSIILLLLACLAVTLAWGLSCLLLGHQPGARFSRFALELSPSIAPSLGFAGTIVALALASADGGLAHAARHFGSALSTSLLGIATAIIASVFAATAERSEMRQPTTEE